MAAVSAGLADVQGVLESVVQQATACLGTGRPVFECVHVYLGGLNVDEVRETIVKTLAPRRVSVQRESSGDAVFACAPLWGFDIAVMGGTGSIALGMNRAGERRVLGGWGALLDDRGSGHAVGLAALRVLAELLDFGSEYTRLLPSLVSSSAFSGHVDDELLSLCHRDPRTLTYTQRLSLKEAFKGALPGLVRHEIASLCPIVAEAARQGDAAAIRIWESAGADLARLACGLVAELGMQHERPVIVGVGGVFGAGGLVWEPFRQAVHACYPDAVVRETDFSLAAAAVIRALQESGLEVDRRVMQEVVQSIRSSLTERRSVSSRNGGV